MLWHTDNYLNFSARKRFSAKYGWLLCRSNRTTGSCKSSRRPIQVSIAFYIESSVIYKYKPHRWIIQPHVLILNVNTERWMMVNGAGEDYAYLPKNLHTSLHMGTIQSESWMST